MSFFTQLHCPWPRRWDGESSTALLKSKRFKIYQCTCLLVCVYIIIFIFVIKQRICGKIALPVGEVSVGEVSVGEVSVGEVSVGEVSVGEMSIGEMSIGETQRLIFLFVLSLQRKNIVYCDFLQSTKNLLVYQEPTCLLFTHVILRSDGVVLKMTPKIKKITISIVLSHHTLQTHIYCCMYKYHGWERPDTLKNCQDGGQMAHFHQYLKFNRRKLDRIPPPPPPCI